MKESWVARKNDVLKAEDFLTFQKQAQTMAGRKVAENDSSWLKKIWR